MVHILSYRRMGVDVCYPTTHHAARGTKWRSTLNLYYYRLYYTQVGSMTKQSAFRNTLARYFTEQKRVVRCPCWCKGRKLFVQLLQMIRLFCKHLLFLCNIKIIHSSVTTWTSEFFLIHATNADLIYSLTWYINSNSVFNIILEHFETAKDI